MIFGIRAASTALIAAFMLPAVAHADVSYNIGLFSLYKSKGVDQNSSEPKNFKPAWQGGIDWSAGNGFYLGNWNSTGEFGDADIEIDLYGGYGSKLTDDLSYDLGVLTYAYPGNGLYGNATEIYGSMTWSGLKFHYNRVVTKEPKGNQTFGVLFSHAVMEKITLSIGAGFRKPKEGEKSGYGILGSAYDFGDGWSGKLEVSGADESVHGDWGKIRPVASVTKTF